MEMINWMKRWDDDSDPWDGSVNGVRKYFVGTLEIDDKRILVADVAIDAEEAMWRDLNIPFESVAEAKQWCEMIEATGAY
jgi:hypothetical protein